MNAFMWGVGGVLVIAMTLLIIPIFVGMARKIAVPAGATTWFKPKWLGGFVGVVIFGWLLYTFWPNLSNATEQVATTGTASTVDTFVSIAILLALAAGGAFGKFGTSGKMTLAGMAMVIVLFGPTGAFKLWSNIQSSAKNALSDDIKLSLPALTSKPAEPSKPLNPEFHLNLGYGQKSNYIRVNSTQCIRFWNRENLLAEGTFITYYCGLGGQNCKEFIPGKPANGARWVFEGNEPDKVTKITYTIYENYGKPCE